MKTRIIIAILMLSSVIGYSQGGTNGGVITGKSKTGKSHDVVIDSTAPNRFPLFVKDSTLNALFAAKDSTKDRKWISIDSFPTRAATSANQLSEITSLDTIQLGVKQTGQDFGIKAFGVMGIDANGLASPIKTNTSGNLETKMLAVDSTNLAGINSKLGGTLTVGTHAVTGTFWQATQPVSGTFWQATQPVSGTFWQATQPVSGTFWQATQPVTNTPVATSILDSTYTAVQMDTAGLGAMANSATVGWQSDSVGLRQWKCTDVKIGVKISMANTAPANDKAVYVYVYPLWYDGSTWYFTSQGTTTLPTGANGTTTIAAPNNLRLLGVLSYTTTNMVLQDQFLLSNAFGSTMPDAFGIILVDYSGAAIHTTNLRIYYSLINKVQR